MTWRAVLERLRARFQRSPQPEPEPPPPRRYEPPPGPGYLRRSQESWDDRRRRASEAWLQLSRRRRNRY